MKRFVPLAVVFVLLAARPAPADPKPELRTDAKAAAKPVVVPFELFKSKHIAVDIKINGKGPYRVVFDTGAPLSLLSTKVAKENKLLDPRAPKPLFNPFGAGGEAKIKKLEIGDLVVENTSAMVMDHPAIQAMSEAFGRVEGIVGFPVFARYKMTLDYQAKTMTFVPTDYKPPEGLAALEKAMKAALTGDSSKVLAPAAQWGMVVDKKDGDKEAGVVIKEVLPGGAAAKAGLKAGDRLLTLDGRWTDSVNECFLAATLVKPGEEVTLVVRRDLKDVEITVKPVSGL